jgi:hypothetical protein
MFEVGDVFRGKYLIESVVPFFQGELAIAMYNSQRYYLQSANLHKQAPARAIAQYQNLQLQQIIPYREVIVDADMFVFVRPYIPIRPLREVIENQELSEEQVVRWVRELLHVETVLRAKPMSMYLLLDLRNIGVTSQNELKVFFCGLEQIMVYESKLDWGTFIYSMLSGQFLDGPILKLPRNFKVSRPMARLIQRSFKEYTVPPVLEQVELFENKQLSGNILNKFWGDKKEKTPPLLTPNTNQKSLDSPIGRSIHRTSETGPHVAIHSMEFIPVLNSDLAQDVDKDQVMIIERGTLVNEEDPKNVQVDKVGREDTPVQKEEPISTEEPTVEKEKETEKANATELENHSHPKSNLTTVKVSPALAQLDGQDLSQSFVLKLNMQQEELEKQQQERLAKMRQEFEKREQELIEQHQKKLAEEQQRLLETQREKLEQEQKELLRKKREEIAKMEAESLLAKKRQEEEKRRKAKLSQARKQFEANQQQLLEQEEKAFQDRQKALLAQLTAEFEERKHALLANQQAEFKIRTEQKIAELQVEWDNVEATSGEEVVSLHVESTNSPIQVTEESDKTKTTNEARVLTGAEQTFSMVDDLVAGVEETQPNDQPIPSMEREGIFAEPESELAGQEEKINVAASNTVFDKSKSVIGEPIEKTGKEEQIKAVADAVFGKAKLSKEEVKNEVKEEVKNEVKEEVKEEPTNRVESVFTDNVVPVTNINKQEVTSEVEALEANEEDEDSSNVNPAIGEEGPQKKKRRRKRRRKKKTPVDADATGEVAAVAETTEVATVLETTEVATVLETTEAATFSETAEANNPSLDEERRKRELELEQMEQELLELDEQEKVQPKSKPPVQELEKWEPLKQQIKKIEPKTEPKIEFKPKQSSLSPVVHEKAKIPIVKDTTEHATLAQQFEQYLKLFKKRK